MEFLTLKALTASVIMSTAISTSAIPATPVPVSVPAQTYDDAVSLSAVKADNAVNLPKAKVSAMAAVVSTMAIPKFTLADASDPLDAWINGLIQKESNGRTDLKVMDVNGHYSYGCLQFQMPTFIAYGRKYGFLTGNEDNLGSLIMNCSLQKTIARKMILDDSSNWRHWYTSVVVKNLGLPPVGQLASNN